MKFLKLVTLLVCICSCQNVHFTQGDLLNPSEITRISDYKNISEDFIVINDSIKIHILYTSKNKYNKPSIFYLHGNSGNSLSNHAFNMFKWLHQQGYQVITMDYRGYGKSGGEPGLRYIKKDVSLVYDSLKSRGLAKNLIVYGYSLGTWPALHLSKKPECPPLILEGILANPKQVGSARLKNLGIPLRWFVSFSVDSSLNIIDTREIANEIQCPVLMLHGKNDKTIPVQFAKQIYATLPSKNKQLIIFQNGEHGLLNSNPEMLVKEIKAFSDSLVFDL